MNPLRFLFVSLAVLLGACATPPPPQSEDSGQWRTDAGYFETRGTLIKTDTWRYQAKVGVTTQEGRDQASLDWQYKDQANAIRLFGPLGFGAVKIEFDESSVVLSDNRGVVHQGDNVEELIGRVVGWPIPVQALSDWLFLTPVASFPYRFKLGANQELLTLEQLGWRIVYRDYRDYNGILLPRKISAKRLVPDDHWQATQVRLISKNWQW